MSSNNCEFQEKHYTQINGATIGGPESASTTDIFRAVFIDEPALKEGPFEPLEFCGYRDDMFDVEITKTKEEINAFTDFLNGLIPGIRFKPKIREDKIDFLDTMVTIENGYLITSPYSKPTDSKQYLVPSSVHKENVVNNIPKTVGMRLRRLCSDRVEGDRIFAEYLDEYRAYMEARGYDPMNIRGHFAEIANLKRQDALKKVERRKRNGRKDQYFLLNRKNLLSKYREINSETLETSTQRFGIKRTLSKKFVHNILQTPEKFKGTFMPIKTTEEKTRNH